MSIKNSSARWGALAQCLHWSTVLLIAATIPIGWLANTMERGLLERQLFDIHFQLGAAILIIVAARIAWRIFDPPPHFPGDLSPLVRRTAKASHHLMYALLLTMVVSGYMIQVHMRPSLVLLGLHIPRPFEPGEDESIRAAAWYVHTYVVWLLGALISIHVAAALWHHFCRRDDVMVRMMPQSRRRRITYDEQNVEIR